MAQIRHLAAHRPDTALAGLNRLTGLDFEQWPESLLHAATAGQKKADLRGRLQAQELTCDVCVDLRYADLR